MDKIKLLVLLVAICLVVLSVMYLYKKAVGGKNQEKPDERTQDNQLIETIRVEKRYDYQEDPDEEGECGDAVPLDDAEGLFDKDKTPKDRKTLIDIMQKQGFKVRKGK